MVTPSALYVQGAQVQRLLQTRSTEATPSDPHCRGTCGYRLSRLLLLWLLLLSDPILLLHLFMCILLLCSQAHSLPLLSGMHTLRWAACMLHL